MPENEVSLCSFDLVECMATVCRSCAYSRLSSDRACHIMGDFVNVDSISRQHSIDVPESIDREGEKNAVSGSHFRGHSSADRRVSLFSKMRTQRRFHLCGASCRSRENHCRAVKTRTRGLLLRRDSNKGGRSGFWDRDWGVQRN